MEFLEAVLQQRIMFSTNAEADDVRREIQTPSDVVSDFMANLSDEEKCQFNKDWNNDEFFCPLEEVEEHDFPWEEPVENQVGEGGKRKSVNEIESSPKRMKLEEYFIIKSVKQVNVRKFKTTGIDCSVQFHPLNIHGVSDVMSVLNRAFKHLFDRLTTDMAPDDQVRLILNSHQLDRPILLPFLPRYRLTPERFLAAVERVVQSNDHFAHVNVVHVEMPHGGTGRKRDVVNLQSYLNKKQCLRSRSRTNMNFVVLELLSSPIISKFAMVISFYNISTRMALLRSDYSWRKDPFFHRT